MPEGPSTETPQENAPEASSKDSPATTAVTEKESGEKKAAESTGTPSLTKRWAAGVYVVCVIVYAIFAGDRLLVHSPDNHFAYQADSFLHGTLQACAPDERRLERCRTANPSNPNACRALEVSRNHCPPGGGGNDWARYEGRWYVAFPSFPAVVYVPAVALLGRDFPNRALDVLLAGVAPALLFLLLERLSREKKSGRSTKENLALTALHAFGTVYFYSAVQGSVWFTAHIYGTALLVGYLWFALDARNPALAGLLLAMGMHTRASLVYASPFFLIEAVRVHRQKDEEPWPEDAGTINRFRRWITGTDWSKAFPTLLKFGIPMAIGVFLSLYLNKLRFDDWGEVGYRYLQIAWRARIERWGLFNYHYLSRNLAIATASLPWFTRDFPYILISLHGVALWVTTPHYLELLRLRRRAGDPYTPFLAWTAAGVALVSLLYQNSGWIQFGYRFSNDYAVCLVLLIAINGVAVGRKWLAVLALAIAVNAFGAATFDRQLQWNGRRISFYDNDYSQQRYFQPD